MTKLYKLEDAGRLLDKSSEEIMTLLKHSFLDGVNVEGELKVTKESLDKYRKRFGIQIPEASKEGGSKLSLKECVGIFGCEKTVHELIQKGVLKASFKNGKYQIDSKSVEKHLRRER